MFVKLNCEAAADNPWTTALVTSFIEAPKIIGGLGLFQHADAEITGALAGLPAFLDCLVADA